MICGTSFMRFLRNDPALPPVFETRPLRTVKDESSGNFFNNCKVVMERVYKDNQGNFKTINSLAINDIPKAILALYKAYDYLASTYRKTDNIKDYDPWAVKVMAQILCLSNI